MDGTQNILDLKEIELIMNMLHLLKDFMKNQECLMLYGITFLD
jgi:hypothetical protein